MPEKSEHVSPTNGVDHNKIDLNYDFKIDTPASYVAKKEFVEN